MGCRRSGASPEDKQWHYWHQKVCTLFRSLSPNRQWQQKSWWCSRIICLPWWFLALTFTGCFGDRSRGSIACWTPDTLWGYDCLYFSRKHKFVKYRHANQLDSKTRDSRNNSPWQRPLWRNNAHILRRRDTDMDVTRLGDPVLGESRWLPTMHEEQEQIPSVFGIFSEEVADHSSWSLFRLVSVIPEAEALPQTPDEPDGGCAKAPTEPHLHLHPIPDLMSIAQLHSWFATSDQLQMRRALLVSQSY